MNIFDIHLKRLTKMCIGEHNGYKKRVHHDLLVPKIQFQDRYDELKEKYIHWVDHWVEQTDPQKHVFEDISIAAFLICLWENEQQEFQKEKQTFMDLGCGNGFLVHILTQEGYKGYGLDISKRQSWDLFQGSDLRQETLVPPTASYPGVDWIIGNHPDELTLWIPILAAKSGYNTKFMIIPCCFHNLSGSRFTDVDHTIGRYYSFLQAVEQMVLDCCYQPEREALRIPSTKNIAIIGRTRTISEQQDIQSEIQSLYQGVVFVPRLSDKEKNSLRLNRKNNISVSNTEESIQENLEFLSLFEEMNC